MPLHIELPEHGPGWTRFGNKIFQALVSERFSNLLDGDVLIHGCQVPGYFGGEYLGETGTDLTALKASGEWINLTTQQIPYDLVVRQYQRGLIKGVTVSMWGMRIRHLESSLPHLRQWLDQVLEPIEVPEVTDDEILISIRLGDIATEYVFHPDYYPLPISYYQRVISESGLKPIFVGQLTPCEYLLQLSQAFPEAEFLEPDILSSFKMIREAKNKVIAVSSFAYLAAWSGREDTTVVMPIAGLFNPMQRPDVNLMPTDDPRFSYRYFAPARREDGEGLMAFMDRLDRTSQGFPLT